MEEINQGHGSFKFLRGFLGTIAGGLSSLASFPFGKRKKPEDPLLLGASSQSPSGVDQTGDDLSKLYPDMELSETRKRARLSIDEILERRVQYNTGSPHNYFDLKGVGGSIDTGLKDPQPEFEGALSPVNEAQHLSNQPVEGLDAMESSSPSFLDVSNDENETPESPSISPKGLVSGDDKELHNGGEDSVTLSDAVEDLNEYLASFRSTLIAKRTKEYNLTENSLKEDSPRKKLSFGRFSLGDNQTNIGSESSKKGSTRSKRKRSHEAEDKGVEKITALVLDDPVHLEEKAPPVGMGSTVTKKRGKADDVEAPLKTDPEELNLCKVVLVENLPLNATKKDVVKEFSQFGVIDSVLLQPVFSQDVKKRKRVTKNEEVNKVAIHQSAHIVYEDEQAVRAAVGHNMIELNGNLLQVSAAHTPEVRKEESLASVNELRSVFVSNTPVDVKDEELHHLFTTVRSLKLGVKSVRVMRDPHTALSKGTAYVYFNTEDDVNRLLQSRQTLKLRGRVLRVSRALVSCQSEAGLLQPQLTKHAMNQGPDQGHSKKRQAEAVATHKDVTTKRSPGKGGKSSVSKDGSGTISVKEPTEVCATSQAPMKRKGVTGSDPHSKLEEPSQKKKKKKRAEKYQPVALRTRKAMKPEVKS